MNETPDPAVVREFINQMASRTPDEHAIAQGRLPSTVYVVRADLDYRVYGAYVSLDAAREAVRGTFRADALSEVWERTDPNTGHIAIGLAGSIYAGITPMPLHASHGLPVVDEAAVTAALDGEGPGRSRYTIVDFADVDIDRPGGLGTEDGA